MAVKRKYTPKQRLFIEAYLACGFNATEAARQAGYKGKYNTLSQMGRENLSKPYIREEIDRRLRSVVMNADEVLARISDHATVTLADFVTAEGEIDMKRARARQKMHLVKEYSTVKRVYYDRALKETVTEITSSIKLHDPSAALRDMAKHHKLFTDKVELALPPELAELLKEINAPASEVFNVMLNVAARLKAAKAQEVEP